MRFWYISIIYLTTRCNRLTCIAFPYHYILQLLHRIMPLLLYYEVATHFCAAIVSGSDCIVLCIVDCIWFPPGSLVTNWTAVTHSDHSVEKHKHKYKYKYKYSVSRDPKVISKCIAIQHHMEHLCWIWRALSGNALVWCFEVRSAPRYNVQNSQVVLGNSSLLFFRIVKW